MSLVQIQGNASGTGTLTIAAPSTNTNRTLTLPDLTGTLLINGPTFSATDTATTAIAGTATKIIFDTEIFDTDSAFDGTKFQPTVAGYYQVNCYTIIGVNTNASSCTVYLYKNGVVYQSNVTTTVAGFSGGSQLSTVVSMNGSTDYLEVYGRNAANANLGVSTFSAAMVRAA